MSMGLEISLRIFDSSTAGLYYVAHRKVPLLYYLFPALALDACKDPRVPRGLLVQAVYKWINQHHLVNYMEQVTGHRK